MELNKIKKVPKFFCEKCKYATERKSQFERHLMTAKHQNTYNTYKNTDKKVPNSSKPFSCECGMNYKHRQSLYNHQKICKKIEINNDNNDTNNAVENIPLENEEKKEEMDFEGVSGDTIKEILKQNHEIVDLLVEERKRNNELTNQLIEVSKEAKTVNNNNTINNNVNNTFNLQVFLNEQCKDALNIQDFINSIQLSIEDLQETGRLGYVDGMSRIFVKALNNLDETERPIHCTDAKREVLYIKDQDKWEKESKHGNTIQKTLERIQDKNLSLLPEWREKNPACMDMDSKESDEYIRISMHTLGDNENPTKQNDKIIKNIMKEVTIDKQSSSLKQAS
jgi:hypothetical protein